MRIGFNLLYLKGNRNGGTAVYGLSLLRVLAEQNPKDTFFAFIRRGGVTLDNLPSNVHKCPIRIPRGAVAFRVLLEQTLLPLAGAAKKVELMFSPAFVSPLWGPFRKVTAIHDAYFKVCPQMTRPFQQRYWRVFVPLSILANDAILASSRNTRSDLERFYPWSKGRIHVVYCAPNLALTTKADSYPTKDETPERYILFLSNITPNKNIDLLVEAVKALNDRGFRIQLKVVGNDVHGLLEKAIVQSGGRTYVEPLGYLTEDRLIPLMRKALCLVVPSTYEGFGMTVLDAMAIGTPVLASSVSSLPEVGGNAVLYFDPKSKDDLSDRITQLLDDRDLSLRRRLLQSGRENLKRFSWKASARQLYGIFQSVSRG